MEAAILKRILFITDKNTHGGSLKMFVWLANALSEFYDVWYCNCSREAPFYKLGDDVKFVSIDKKYKSSFIQRNTLGMVYDTKTIIDLIAKYRIDVVVNFADHLLYSLVIAKKKVGFSLLLSQRVDPFSCTNKSDIFRHGLYKYADALVCQTESAKDYFLKAKYNKLKKYVIANPALGRTDLHWNVDDNDGYIISLARIDLQQKRQDVLLDAMKMVHEIYPDVTLRFYGADVDNSVVLLNKKIAENNLLAAASYCGVTKHVYEVLSRAKMMVMSSDYEGIPNAIIEAMEVGLPIIATDCKPGGARLLIGEEEDHRGLIVERNNPVKMAEAILYFLEHEKEAAQMGENARRSLSRFSEEKIGMDWKHVIDDL